VVIAAQFVDPFLDGAVGVFLAQGQAAERLLAAVGVIGGGGGPGPVARAVPPPGGDGQDRAVAGVCAEGVNVRLLGDEEGVEGVPFM
jgi:hypothetical protein